MRLHKISRSVRLPSAAGTAGRIVRLSLNPVLVARSRGLIRWSRQSVGAVSPASVVFQAMQKYPALSLSSAVEMVITDMLVENAPRLTAGEEAGYRRFSCMFLMDQIRLARRRMQTARYVRSLR